MRQEWLEDLAEEARQYKIVYRELLEKTREPLKKRLLEKNMLDKEAQLRCLQRMGSGSGTLAEEDSQAEIAPEVLLYNEIENEAVYAALEENLGESADSRKLRLKQRQIIERLMLYLI